MVCQVVENKGARTRRGAPPSPATQESGWGASQIRAPPSPATQERGWLSAIRQARKFIGLVLLRQPLDQRVQRALEHVRQVVQRQALHPVVGDPALRVGVGADALAEVAAADLPLARGGGGGRLLLGFLYAGRRGGK